LHRELIKFFGIEIMQEAQSIPVATIDAEMVRDASKALLALQGDIDMQIEFIRCMDRQAAISLCRWMIDPSVMPQLSGFSSN